jgi:hypothetical protein
LTHIRFLDASKGLFNLLHPADLRLSVHVAESANLSRNL